MSVKEVILEDLDWIFERNITPETKISGWQRDTVIDALEMIKGYFRSMEIGYEDRNVKLGLDLSRYDQGYWEFKLYNNHIVKLYHSRCHRDIPLVLQDPWVGSKMAYIVNSLYQKGRISETDKIILKLSVEQEKEISLSPLYKTISNKSESELDRPEFIFWMCLFAIHRIPRIRNANLIDFNDKKATISKKYDDGSYFKLVISEKPEVTSGYYIAFRIYDKKLDKKGNKIYTSSDIDDVCIRINTALSILENRKLK